jgi:3-hydroxyisobutyrate dehydrogenase-like beta-hydroxyacid dehydrogenase
MEKIGILHPGEMGASVAVSARNGGNAVFWSSKGRSAKTRIRARQHDILDAGSMEALCQACSIIISVCPPHAAEDVARQVIQSGFTGLYVDANAISPQRALQIDEEMRAANIRFVDGGIIGGPAWQPGETSLYLAGRDAEKISACFSGGPLRATVIGPKIGRASALKMCYAAYSKGSTALLCAVLAAAEALGVRQELYAQWERDQTGFSDHAEKRARRVTAKSWRFEDEMHEIAQTFMAAGLPGGFHEAAAELYHRLSAFKDARESPGLDAVLTALQEKNGAP